MIEFYMGAGRGLSSAAQKRKTASPIPSAERTDMMLITIVATHHHTKQRAGAGSIVMAGCSFKLKDHQPTAEVIVSEVIRFVSLIVGTPCMEESKDLTRNGFIIPHILWL
jgi:hypothetical protein